METTALVFGGIVVSLLVQLIKKKTGTSNLGTLTAVVGLSILGGVAYEALMHYGLWQAAVSILTSAGAFYAFVIRSVSENP
jgi:hypothetical protein